MTEVKEQGPSLVPKSHEKGRVVKGPVDQPRQEGIAHNDLIDK
jgi:hypothetical protein